MLLLQFERACKEVLQDDHQLTAEGEEQHFEDVQVRWVGVCQLSVSKALARFLCGAEPLVLRPRHPFKNTAH